MNGRKLLILAAVLALVFLAGFVPQSVRAGKLHRELAQSRQDLAFSNLTNLMGRVFLETTNKNYGIALDLAGRFFNQGRAMANETSSAGIRQALEKALARRDEITAALARGDAAVYGPIQEIYRVLLDTPSRAL
ncbi:MAG: hypothetical protein ACE15B_21080 [Bryobacteraceae bacterium]